MDNSAAGVFPTAFLPPALLGYLLGSIPFGLVLTRLSGLGDIRLIGSGNIGATNVLRTGRKDLALATLLLDAGKAGLAYLACVFGMAALDQSGHPAEYFQSMGLVAGAAAFIGHCYPVWLQFKGGKGVATYLGLLVAAFWQAGLVFAAIWVLIALAFRMSSLAALAATLAVPLFVWWMKPSGDAWITFGVLGVLIYWRHRANIQRLLAGKEPRIGKKPSADTSASDQSPPADGL